MHPTAQKRIIIATIPWTLRLTRKQPGEESPQRGPRVNLVVGRNEVDAEMLDHLDTATKNELEVGRRLKLEPLPEPEPEVSTKREFRRTVDEVETDEKKRKKAEEKAAADAADKAAADAAEKAAADAKKGEGEGGKKDDEKVGGRGAHAHADEAKKEPGKTR